jgi:Uma2 family endonuclease
MNAAPEHRVPSLTAEEFAALPEEEGFRLELSGGRVVREPAPGPLHGHLAGRFYRLLWRSAEEPGLGLAFFDTAFALARDPATVRIPDAAFVSAERIPEGGLTSRFWELAPDIVVEVVSPSNRASEIQEKALQYLDAGSELVWIADPEMRTVTVYRSRADIRILEAGDFLSGGDVLPNLRVPISELFG